VSFIVVIEETSGLPQMVNISEIISIFANTANSPATMSLVLRGAAIVHTTTPASTALSKALAAGVAADLRP